MEGHTHPSVDVKQEALIQEQYELTVQDMKNMTNGIELEQIECIMPEKDTGNVEYKWKLVKKSQDRITHLTTQMNYRLTEGGGEAFYMVHTLPIYLI